jgi:hypothetical protein
MDPNIEYLELAVDNWDSTSAGGQVWKNGPGLPEQLQFSWSKFYWTQKSPDIIAMKVVSAEIPNVFDSITTGLNTFQFTLAGVPTTITIPVGIYTGTTLATQLQTLIAVVSPGFLVTWSDITLRFTFTFSGGAFTWGFIFPVGRASAYGSMGFLPNTTTTLFNNGSIISPTVASPTGPYYLYLNSRSMGPLVNFNLCDGSPDATGTPQIARIPITVNKGGVIIYTDPTPDRFFDFFVGPKFEVFDLYWTIGSDQSQIPLNMKCVPWSVKFGFLSYRQATSDLRVKPSKRPANMLS